MTQPPWSWLGARGMESCDYKCRCSHGRDYHPLASACTFGDCECLVFDLDAEEEKP